MTINDAAPSGGPLLLISVKDRKGEIYRATSLSELITDPCSHIHLWRFSTAWYGTVRHGSVRYGTAQFGSVAFPPQFSTAIEWAGLFTRRYNCAASTAVTSS